MSLADKQYWKAIFNGKRKQYIFSDDVKKAVQKLKDKIKKLSCEGYYNFVDFDDFNKVIDKIFGFDDSQWENKEVVGFPKDTADTNIEEEEQ